jgi:hypothetical protein
MQSVCDCVEDLTWICELRQALHGAGEYAIRVSCKKGISLKFLNNLVTPYADTVGEEVPKRDTGSADPIASSKAPKFVINTELQSSIPFNRS